MFRFLAMMATVVVAFALAPDASGQTRDVYTVRSIVVDETAPTVVQAREQAFSTARLAGARIMIDRITLKEDRAGSEALILNQAIADRLAAAVDIEEETAGAGRYRGRLTVVFNPVSIRAFLSEAGIAYVDRQAGRSVLVPVYAGGPDKDWNTAWGDVSSGRLVPTVTSRLSVPPRERNWESVQEAAVRHGLQRVILVETVWTESGYVADVYSLTPGSTRKIASTSVVSTLGEVTTQVAELIDTDWKRMSIVRNAGQVRTRARILYDSLSEWNRLRQVLARSPLVSGFRIQTITTTDATVVFVHGDDEQRLVADLRDRGISIDMAADKWLLRSSIRERN